MDSKLAQGCALFVVFTRFWVMRLMCVFFISVSGFAQSELSLERQPVVEFPSLTLSGAHKTENTRLLMVDHSLSNQQFFQTLTVPQTSYDSLSDFIDAVTLNVNSHSIPSIIDVFSHGVAGQIAFGSDVITLANLDEYQVDLMRLKALLNGDSHLNLLGCDIAQSVEGQALVSRLSEMLGVSISASTDKTGLAALGGDWDLEFSTLSRWQQNYSFSTLYQDFEGILPGCDLSGLATAQPKNYDEYIRLLSTPLIIDIRSSGATEVAHWEAWDLRRTSSYGQPVICTPNESYLFVSDGTWGAWCDGYKGEKLTYVLGTGTEADPFTVWGSRYWDRNNSNSYNGNDIKIVTKTTYVAGDQYYDIEYCVESADGVNTDDIRLTHGLHSSLNGEYADYPFTIPFDSNTYGAGTPPYTVLGAVNSINLDDKFVGLQELDRPWDNYYASSFEQPIYTHLALPPRILPDLITPGAQNLGLATQWNLGVVNNADVFSVRVLVDSMGGVISASATDVDRGDAPEGLDLQTAWPLATYPTLNASSGAHHLISGTACLGTTDPASCGSHISSEADGQPEINANADTFDDGVVFNPNEALVNSSALPILQTNIFAGGVETPVTNELAITASENGFVSVWVDLNQDGDWNDTIDGVSERVVNGQAVTASVNSVTFSIPSESVHGKTFVRVRYAGNAAEVVNPSGLATSGEVEDYEVYIAAPSVATYGCDAGLMNGGFEYPSGSGMKLESAMPGWSTMPNDLTITDSTNKNTIETNPGSTYGAPNTPEGSLTAELNAYHAGMLYQDMVTEPGTTIPWQFFYIGRSASGAQQIELLIGPPDGALTQIIAPNAIIGAWQFFSNDYVVPAGQYVTRFGFKSLQSSAPALGNVIDDVRMSCYGLDYGDTPNRSLSADNGAVHQIVGSSLMLGGLAPDPEMDGNPNATLTGDDSFGADDEDAIGAGGALSRLGNQVWISVPLSNTTGGDAYLSVWADLDGSGTWEDDETVWTTIPNGATSGMVMWSDVNGAGPDLTVTSVELRLRLSTDFNSGTSTPLDADSNSVPDWGGAASDGEVEDHLVSVPANTISGQVFVDSNGGDYTINTNTNGVMDGSEVGLGSVAVTLYNVTDNTCVTTVTSDGSSDVTGDGNANSDDIGWYSFGAEIGKSYKIYETAQASLPIDCASSAPQTGTINGFGALVDADISDPIGYTSTTPNALDLGVFVADITGVNFGDFVITPFDVCDSRGFLNINSPMDVIGINLATGLSQTLGNDISTFNVQGAYSMHANVIIGEIPSDSQPRIALVDAGNNVVYLPLIYGANDLNANNAAIDDQGRLFLSTSSDTTFWIVDVNPNSENYLVATKHTMTGIVKTDAADWAFNPIDGKLYALSQSGKLTQIDPNTFAAVKFTVAGVNGNVTKGFGGAYFDDQGNFYGINNGKYTPPNPDILGPILRIPIGDGTNNANLTASLFADIGMQTGSNDGARCHYAAIPLDYADAPSVFITSVADGGPRHLTDTGLPYLGSIPPDNDNDGQPSASADGDDSNGAAPDDEDGFTQPGITATLTGGETLSLSVPVVSSGNDELYGWIDFDGNQTFDADERASVTYSASGVEQLDFLVPNDVVIAHTFIRLRTCSAGSGCDAPSGGGAAADGEVEDHAMHLFPLGDLELQLSIQGGSNTVTRGVPFNLMVQINNEGTDAVQDPVIYIPIPANMTFVRAYAADGETPLTPSEYDPVTGLLTLDSAELGLETYAFLRIAPLDTVATDLHGEIFSAIVNDTDSVMNSGFGDGEDDTKTVSLTIGTNLQAGMCELLNVVEVGSAYVDGTTDEYILTPDLNSQAGTLWSFDYVNLDQPMYAELAIYLGANDGADGLTFMFTTDSRGISAIGNFGGGLGAEGISPSVVIEWDTWNNGSPHDGPLDHTAVVANGDVYQTNPANIIMATDNTVNGGELEDGVYHIAQLFWEPTTNLLTYYLDGVLIGSITNNIRTILGNSIVRFGFSASTGGAKNLQKGCFADAPDVIGKDMGDAPDATNGTASGNYQTRYQDGGAVHYELDANDNNEIDLRLGDLWDTDTGFDHSVEALADGSDEDGAFPPSILTKGGLLNWTITVSEDSLSPAAGRHLYAWFDWNADGDWNDPGEQVIADTNAALGDTSYSISVPATAPTGYTYARVRLCSSTACSSPIGEAFDGEVEDYRTLVSNLVGDAACNLVVQTRTPVGGGADFEYVDLDITTSPVTFDTITPAPLSIDGAPATIETLNSIGLDRIAGIIYGTYVDGTDTDKKVRLFAADKLGNTFVDLGEIKAAEDLSMQSITNSGVFDFVAGDTLRSANNFVHPTKKLGSPIMGDVSKDGRTLVLWRNSWDSFVLVDLATNTFTVKPIADLSVFGTSLGGAKIEMGADLAISEQSGHAYVLDLVGSLLYTMDFSGATVVTTVMPLDLMGMAQPIEDTNGKLQAGGIVMDDAVTLYAITNGGDHDSDKNGGLDVTSKSVIYQVNILTGETIFLSETDTNSLDGNDAAGCYESLDYSDADNALSYGVASHRYIDAAMDGTADLMLGSLWDAELLDWSSATAVGDDEHGIDDDDIDVPVQIVVETPTAIPLDVVGNGYVNVWVDINNDGDFDDNLEQVLIEEPVSDGSNNLPVFLSANTADGFNGMTIMRIRLCENQGECNTPSGIANSGEVEDHEFELLNRIVLNGKVFEDNGVSGGIAHDAVQNGGELPISDFVVQAIYRDATNAEFTTNEILATTTTSGDGTYQIILPVTMAGLDFDLQLMSQGAWIDISEPDLSGLPQILDGASTSTTVMDNKMRINANAGDILNGLDFGKVLAPNLYADNFTEVQPGGSFVFPHTFISRTAGSVSFQFTGITEAPTAGWSQMLIHDAGCDGELDPADVEFSGAITVDTAASTVCLLVKVFVPTDAPAGALYQYTIEGTLVFDVNGVPHNLTQVLTDEDKVRISSGQFGELKLTKRVENLTQGTAKSFDNQAAPQDTLEYEIHYQNIGFDDITEIVIYDNTPTFTRLKDPIACPVSLPLGITACVIATPDGSNTAGYEGRLEWRLTGALASGIQGTVKYQIIVD